MEIVDYQSIRKHVLKLGKEEKIKRRAKELQILLSDGDENIPYRDAYEMAYNEIIVDRLY